MASVQFRLRSNANKNVSIKVRLIIGRNKDVEANTGFTINPKEWSEATNKPKQNTAENKRLFNDLKKLETYLFDNLNNDLADSVIIDKYWLENKINDCFNRIEKVDTGLLVNHIQHIIDNANTRKIKGSSKIGLSENRIKGYITFKNLIKNYQEVIKKQIHLLDVNRLFVEKFTNWLINVQHYSTNYAGKQIDNLKTVCLDAEKLEIPINNQIKLIESFSENDEDRFIATLSFEELETIRKAELENVAHINARKWILIGCETGQRSIDLLSITKDNFRNNTKGIYLDIVQKKTKKHITVGIIKNHIIDIIENDFPYKISSQKLNQYIKEVCKIAKIDEVIEGKKIDKDTKRKKLGFYPKHELIASHCFRRSFATNYYKKIPTPILMNITGHSKESIFLKYINKSEDKDANADLFMELSEKLTNYKEPQLRIIKNASNQ
ncbi:tyrosine-type recombinase/integrase [Flavobacterium soli]|uniref:tyrosine-type recombinase/integrase n=1 Tax=Flavobacterium soli TaxID=344881 RepID=UPI00041D879C|nr:tyrosine-type recombinase/integrase [Flavobacterium soli]